MTEQQKTLIDFPCHFTLKVMGEQHPQFGEHMMDALRTHVAEICADHITLKASSKGNYVSATIVVYAENQDHLDNMYRTLTTHPMVKFVL
jgi:putative lipoic acid-binding regulatory protein